MLRKYPLTTLFIVATICVDAALVVSANRQDLLNSDSGWPFYLWNSLLPAQISTLAVWGVFGKTHRLTKAAVVTLLGAAFLWIQWLIFQEMFFNELTFVNLLQISGVIVGSLMLRICGLGKPTNSDQQPFQFSLIEMFGWSMIVALWAFAFRSSAGKFPVDWYTSVWLVGAIVAPLCVLPALYGKMSITQRLAAFLASYVLVLVFSGVAYKYYGNEAIINFSLIMAITQISYISTWWAVMRMDEAMQERQAISEASREKLALFDPDPR
jgi:general stress protein CsbA